jgi:hypothetical protein
MASGYEITSGPGRFDLLISLGHGDCANRTTVAFTLNRPGNTPITIEMVIEQLTRRYGMPDGGTEDSWFFVGYEKQGVRSSGSFYTWPGLPAGFRAKYNSQTRKGTLHVYTRRNRGSRTKKI